MDTMRIIKGVGLATLAQTALGFLWYSPFLFGPTWMRLTGITPETPMHKAHLIALITSALIASVLYCFIYRLRLTTLKDGALFGLTAWAGFVLTIMMQAVAFEGHSLELFWINAGFQAVALTVAGAIVALFV